MKTLLPLAILAGIALLGCGSKESTATGPMDSNRPPTPGAQTGANMTPPPPTAATTGG